jgi:hypothetical protein
VAPEQQALNIQEGMKGDMPPKYLSTLIAVSEKAETLNRLVHTKLIQQKWPEFSVRNFHRGIWGKRCLGLRTKPFIFVDSKSNYAGYFTSWRADAAFPNS